ncbi:MAG: helix-turn-helix domain-containing protein [Rhodobacteraceae bacterium]|nr:helix-turn-helix domain-containing protein [Paracoccaceae bacterium]
MAQRKPALEWPQIVGELHLRGMTMTELARRNGLPMGSCGRVKGQTHYKAQQAIGEFIGYKPEDLWPDRYPKGKPRILDTKKYPPVASPKDGTAADKRSVA